MSAAPHNIRLRGPWECQVLEALADSVTAANTSALARVKMPCNWSDTLGPGFRGRVRFTRHFNRPTNLHEEPVWLVLDHLLENARLEFNGAKLAIDSGRTEITARLQPFNTVAVELQLPVDQPAPTQPICDVRLEIHS